MGLDQYFVYGDKGSAPRATLCKFRKHSRLQGYMERLAYQKNIVDPFERRQELNYREAEQQLLEKIRATYPSAEVKRGEAFKNKEEDNLIDVIVVTPELDMVPYLKGRLNNELVPLTLEDICTLKESIVKYLNGEEDLFPETDGLFFGDTFAEHWIQTLAVIEFLEQEFNFAEHALYYTSNW